MGLFSSQISTKKMVPLCRQLATAYEAGIPIIQSMDLVTEKYGRGRERQIITGVADDLRNGSTLADAARARTKYFPRFFVELLASGERGGKLDVMLRDLAQYFEDRLEMRRTIVRLMTYPILQLTFAWFLGTFALRLVGRLATLFSDARGVAPFSFEVFLREYAVFQAWSLGFFALVFLGCVVLARLGLFGWIWGAVSTFVWPLSPVTKRFALARFFRSLSLLLGSGVRVDQCIENAAAVTANPYIERDLLRSVPLIRGGSTLVQAFAGCRYLTRTAREMLLVGEQSGKLDFQLRKVADYHMEEANHAVQVATRIVTVLMVLAVAVLIGYIYITFMLTYYGGILDGFGI